MMADIRVAAVTCQAPVGAIEANLARTRRWTLEARAAGADLVCFPELNITGYSTREVIPDIAQPIPGPVSRQLTALAVETGLFVLAGMVEHNPGAPPFASHCVFSPGGQMGIYRKLYLPPPERKLLQAGNHIPLFQMPTAAFGIQLCYDAHFPELATAMTHKGAHILFMPHASPRGDAHEKHLSWLRHLPARAFDNAVFVVACNQCGDNEAGLAFAGNALVIGPSGRIINQKVSGEEGLLIANLKADDLKSVRSHPMRHFFPNRRPELY